MALLGIALHFILRFMYLLGARIRPSLSPYGWKSQPSFVHCARASVFEDLGLNVTLELSVTRLG